jgi:hypothetical protein
LHKTWLRNMHWSRMEAPERICISF